MNQTLPGLLSELAHPTAGPLAAFAPLLEQVTRLGAEPQATLSGGDPQFQEPASNPPRPDHLWGRDGRPNLGAFTDRARKCLSLARATAARLGHSVVGTGHLLSGIAHEGSGIGGHVLAGVGLSGTAIDAYLAESVGRYEPLPTGVVVYESPGWARALTNACAEALRLKHNRVGTEHLLMSCVRDVSFFSYGLCDMCLPSAQVVVENTLLLCAPELPALVRAVELCTPHFQIVTTSLSAMRDLAARCPAAVESLEVAASAITNAMTKFRDELSAASPTVTPSGGKCPDHSASLPVAGTLMEAVSLVRLQGRKVLWGNEVVGPLNLAHHVQNLTAQLASLAILAQHEGWGAGRLSSDRPKAVAGADSTLSDSPPVQLPT